jgi:hypothetical protein
VSPRIFPAEVFAAKEWPSSRQGVLMKLYAPNIALFVIAGCLAMLGVLAAMPIELPIPALEGNSSWYIFLAWFLLAAGSVVPPAGEKKTEAKSAAKSEAK